MGHVGKMYRKSSYSGGANSADCVEVASVSGGTFVRDSKDQGGHELAISHAAWRVFGRQVKAGAAR